MNTIYIIYETQTDADGNVAHLPPVDKPDLDEAWSAYYLTLSYAVRSIVAIHTVMLCDNCGRVIDVKSFSHMTPEPLEVET